MNRMLREFRGKRKDNGEYVSKWDNSGWVYGFYYETPKYPSTQFDPPSSETIGIIVDTNPCSYPDILVDKETVGRFTGKQDRNGKDIYTDDIVRDVKGNIKELLVVKFSAQKYLCAFVATNNEECNPYYHLWYNGFEVVGNIHDNPELLDEER